MFEILVVYQSYKKNEYKIKQQKVCNKIEMKRKEFTKQKLCQRQKYVLGFLAKNEQHVFSHVFGEIKWQTTSFTFRLTLVSFVHHLTTIYLTFSFMASFCCFLLDFTHFTPIVSIVPYVPWLVEWIYNSTLHKFWLLAYLNYFV